MDTHVSDYAVGTNFFKDAFRLHEGVYRSHSDAAVVAAVRATHVHVCCEWTFPDLLCAGAKQALDVMFPESANSTIGCFNSKTPIQ